MSSRSTQSHCTAEEGDHVPLIEKPSVPQPTEPLNPNVGPPAMYGGTSFHTGQGHPNQPQQTHPYQQPQVHPPQQLHPPPPTQPPQDNEVAYQIRQLKIIVATFLEKILMAIGVYFVVTGVVGMCTILSVFEGLPGASINDADAETKTAFSFYVFLLATGAWFLYVVFTSPGVVRQPPHGSLNNGYFAPPQQVYPSRPGYPSWQGYPAQQGYGYQ
eukprot:m.369283 g.369283  ORF g.369283 m.369283 type:complete len:215 (+) comp16675_c0_seq7:1753-2397(+)